MLPTNKAKDYGYIEPKEFDRIVSTIQAICKASGLLWWQPSEPSILAACEDPETLLSYYELSTARVFPLQQTNQMWLEYALLSGIRERADMPGLYCLTESYRDEIKQAQRHKDRIINKRFNMFEIEQQGGYQKFIALFIDILIALGVKSSHIEKVSYKKACTLLKQDPESYILTDADEVWLNQNVAPCVLLCFFPERTNPFWNMHMLHDGTAAKFDLILGGMECAGGAERSTDIPLQEKRFYTMPGYKERLYSEFGQDRVLKELDYYFSLLTPLSVRSGCGIGLSRLAAGLQRYRQQIS